MLVVKEQQEEYATTLAIKTLYYINSCILTLLSDINCKLLVLNKLLTT